MKEISYLLLGPRTAQCTGTSAEVCRCSISKRAVKAWQGYLHPPTS